MYESLVMVDPADAITVEQLAAELRRFYEGKPGAPAEIVRSGQDIELRWPDYVLAVGRSRVPHVLEESKEIAEQAGQQHPAREQIASCTCRFEMSGDDDPDMDHFNDYLFVGEALCRLGRVYWFDQASCEFQE